MQVSEVPNSDALWSGGDLRVTETAPSFMSLSKCTWAFRFCNLNEGQCSANDFRSPAAFQNIKNIEVLQTVGVQEKKWCFVWKLFVTGAIVSATKLQHSDHGHGLHTTPSWCGKALPVIRDHSTHLTLGWASGRDVFRSASYTPRLLALLTPGSKQGGFTDPPAWGQSEENVASGLVARLTEPNSESRNKGRHHEVWLSLLSHGSFGSLAFQKGTGKRPFSLWWKLRVTKHLISVRTDRQRIIVHLAECSVLRTMAAGPSLVRVPPCSRSPRMTRIVASCTSWLGHAACPTLLLMAFGLYPCSSFRFCTSCQTIQVQFDERDSSSAPKMSSLLDLSVRSQKHRKGGIETLEGNLVCELRKTCVGQRNQSSVSMQCP